MIVISAPFFHFLLLSIKQAAVRSQETMAFIGTLGSIVK